MALFSMLFEHCQPCRWYQKDDWKSWNVFMKKIAYSSQIQNTIPCVLIVSNVWLWPCSPLLLLFIFYKLTSFHDVSENASWWLPPYSTYRAIYIVKVFILNSLSHLSIELGRARKKKQQKRQQKMFLTCIVPSGQCLLLCAVLLNCLDGSTVLLPQQWTTFAVVLTIWGTRCALFPRGSFLHEENKSSSFLLPVQRWESGPVLWTPTGRGYI